MLTQEELKLWLDYDHETGIFRWARVNSNRVYKGRIAGTIRKGSPYVTIAISRKFYYAHRLAWLYVYGEWPTMSIDHADRNPSNNAISNLRLATFTQNSWNKLVDPRSKTGLKGVWVQGRRFAAYIGSGRKRIRLGLFDTAQDAHKAYIKAAREMHGEFSSV